MLRIVWILAVAALLLCGCGADHSRTLNFYVYDGGEIDVERVETLVEKVGGETSTTQHTITPTVRTGI